MIIFPAIDLYQGKAVRLYKGDYDRMTVYGDDATAVAKDFVSCGATHMHVVDLEGAKDGVTHNFDMVKAIVAGSGIFAEVGGGIRNMATVERYFDCGVSRVILGTAAVNDEKFLREAVRKYGNKIAVGADVDDGFVAVRGWLEKSSVTLDDFLARMQNIGVNYIVCTDISRDGAMRGANLRLYRELVGKYGMNITASGGVSTLADIVELRRMGLYGAIVGKAYYDGAIDLKSAIEAAR